MMNVRNKKVLVVGLGVSGFCASKLLASKGAKVKITESANTPEVANYLAKLSPYALQYEIGGHSEAFCNDAELVVTSPGVSASALPIVIAKKKKIPIIGELELGSRFNIAPIIAVTGTNGKSTTTTLIGKILSQAGKHVVVCGNIGNPLSGEIDSITKESIVVVEVSSFQLEWIGRFRPHIAVILNVSENHYERHANFDSYKEAKFRIFMNQTKNDYAVLNSTFCDDPLTKDIKSRIYFFKELIIKINDIPLKGRHNIENISAAAIVSRITGISDSCIREAVMQFKSLPHRLEKVGEFDGIECIDDSKATSIDAARSAIEAVKGDVVLIAGGRDKGGDYASIAPLVKKKVKTMILIGEAAPRIKNAFSNLVPMQMARDMKEAVVLAFHAAKKGQTILLSPMCSSFDMFSGYEERGDMFQEEVKLLGKAYE